MRLSKPFVGARAAEALHWLRAFGIADSDGLDANQLAAKRERGVYALPYYSVEAIYFHPWVIGKIASRQASVSGADSSELMKAAIVSGVATIKDHTYRLSQKAAKKALRKSVMEQIPNNDDLLAGQNIQIVNYSTATHAARKEELDSAVVDGNWKAILTACPVRESDALESISKVLGFRKRQDYQKAVRHLLAEDADTLNFVRDLFGDLTTQILG